MKNNKVLVIMVIILCVLILVLSGYIIYDKILKENINNNFSNITTEYDIDVKYSGTKQEVIVKKNEITQEAIENLFDLIGLPRTGSDGNYLLNYYISNNDYSKYTKEIISYYANTWDNNSLFKNVSEDIMNDEVCEGSGFCMSINKTDAKKLFELYNFNSNFSDYFKTTDLLEDGYIFIVANTSIPVIFNSQDANIQHEIESYNMLGTDIGITDTQIITIVDENDFSNLRTINKIVKYQFKMNDNGNYYLYEVTVK